MKHGFFLIDKEKGINSFKLVIALRKMLSMRRVGFAGTLDPLATGLMVMAFGEYTKLLPYLESADKVYEVTIRLDGTSDTYDAEGQISELNPSSYERPLLAVVNKKIEQNFIGKLEQIPPRFSAISMGGQRAYEMARSGQEFEMKPRQVEIFSIELLEYDFPRLRLRVHCSSGTYIRSLAYDLGKTLGVGGYVEELRRVKIGNIPIEDASPLVALQSGDWSKLVVPVERLLSGMSVLNLTDEQYRVLALGNFVDNCLKVAESDDVRGGNSPILAAQLNSGTSRQRRELHVENLRTLAIYNSMVVGVLETCENGRKLKFKKKLNIF
jgi:tRNA pseudouridine55 synthase